MMFIVVLMILGGWEIVSAVILFAASVYGFLATEIAEEIVIAEIAEELAEEIVEETASSAAAGGLAN